MTKPIAIALYSAIFALTTITSNVMAEEAKELSTQQNKMGSCNKEAGEKALKGEERKTFMKSCLSAKKSSQQDKMKTCNKDAKEKALKGDDRKKYMSECLSS